MRNTVQLITYPNRFGGQTLEDLWRLLRGPLRGLFGGVHILPFYYTVDGFDAGFDPIDHTQVDPNVGSWDDIGEIAKDVDVMADVIVNHISSHSPQFRDYRQRGMESRYSGLFLTKDAVYPDGAREEDLQAIYRPRPGLPFTAISLADGTEKAFWTTFTPQQIDIDVNHPEGIAYLDSILDKLQEVGVRAVRLDAVGYAIKRAGRNCFMMPETLDFIDGLAARARARNIEVLVEVHSYYQRQIEIASRVDWVYDFALPPLILHAFAFGVAKYLKEWVRIRPTNAVTVLDTHDGIGIIDAGPDTADRDGRPGLVPAGELDALVELIHERTDCQSRSATGAAASNLDLYQINCTYFDAMGRCEHEYLLARAIQLMLPGIPQVYYVGLLAGSNDMDLLARTGTGRDINRHFYSRKEVEDALERPVVQRLMDIIRLRNAHEAFSGQFSLSDGEDEQAVMLRWDRDGAFVELHVDFRKSHGTLRFSSPQGARTETATVQQWEFARPLESGNAG